MAASGILVIHKGTQDVVHLQAPLQVVFFCEVSRHAGQIMSV